MTRQIPRDRWPDSTIALLRDGYLFLPGRFTRLKTDVFTLRLMGRRAICLHGSHWAKVFYDTDLFTRRGAMPRPIQRTLVGRGGIQMQDGEEHRLRKEMFMAMMGPDSIAELLDACESEWQEIALRWAQGGRFILMDEMQALLCGAVCRWLGLQLSAEEAAQKGRWMGQMVDGFGSAGLRHLRARLARRRAEAWAVGVIRRLRADVERDGRAASVALQKDAKGKFLDEHDAAVDLLNLVRPVVAIATYIAFIAHALDSFPEARRRLAEGEEEYRRWFVQEVRRFYPFTPFVGARVRRSFEQDGVRFRKGRLVILDVYGLQRDARLWESPDAFRPERFASWKENAYDFIPQGGGDHHRNHRCAGEWITIAVMEQAAEWLAARLRYALPKQDMSIPLRRVPTRPQSGVVIEDITLAPQMTQSAKAA